MVRSICRCHGDLINRHEYLIYLAILGSKSLASLSPTRSSTIAWFQWWEYLFLIKWVSFHLVRYTVPSFNWTISSRWESLRKWIYLCMLRIFALLGMAPNVNDIQSVAAQISSQKQMGYLASWSTLGLVTQGNCLSILSFDCIID